VSQSSEFYRHGLLLNECLFFARISLSTQSGNFWIRPRIQIVLQPLRVEGAVAEGVSEGADEERAALITAASGHWATRRLSE
jgi:hypothetical protein